MLELQISIKTINYVAKILHENTFFSTPLNLFEPLGVKFISFYREAIFLGKHFPKLRLFFELLYGALNSISYMPTCTYLYRSITCYSYVLMISLEQNGRLLHKSAISLDPMKSSEVRKAGDQKMRQKNNMF